MLIKSVMYALGLTILKLNGATPEVTEFVLHYICGSKKEKTLPESLMKDSRESVLLSIRGTYEHPGQYVGDKTYNIYPKGICPSICINGDYSDWFKGQGVVGSFNVNLIPVEGGFKAECYDHWDFNACSKSQEFNPDEYIYFKSGKYTKVVQRAAKLLGFNLIIGTSKEGCFIEESLLSRFNSAHSFWTRWEHQYSYKELGFTADDVLLFQGTMINKNHLKDFESEWKKSAWDEIYIHRTRAGLYAVAYHKVDKFLAAAARAGKSIKEMRTIPLGVRSINGFNLFTVE